MKVLLASGNQHKVDEFNELFFESKIQIQASDEKLEIIEDGETFFSNAQKKAEGYFKKYNKPVMADDSGLVVEALPEELGIYSARFGGEGLSDRERAELLVEKLKNHENRNAHFVCVLCFYLSPEEIYFFEGRMDGEVGHAYRGEHGFGYDPVFIPKHHEGDASLAMLPDWKKEHSHRSQACAAAQSFFNGQN